MKAKKLFFHSFQLIKKLIPFSLLNQIGSHSVIFPFYHTISDGNLPHITNLYSVKNTLQFKKDLDFLLQHYQPISIIDLIEQKEITKPSFLLSFDDGLAEFDQVIAPILLEKGIPAINFLNSAFIDNKTLFFRYKVSLIIEKLIQEPRWLGHLNYPTIHSAKTYLLSLQYKDISTINQIAQKLEIDFDHFLSQQQPYLTSIQINQLIDKGFHFGAHSIDHPEYQYISESNQLSQTQRSISVIQHQFKLKYSSFSFPFTDYNVKESFFERLKAEEQTIYTFGSAGQKIETIQNHFQRIPFENAQFSAKEILKGEYLYYLLKQPLGKNYIRR